MSYKIIAKYSNQLSNVEWRKIKESFNLVFEKDFDLKYFKSKYCLNILGFSCHGILYNDNVVVGCFTILPRNYNFFGTKKLIGVGADAFVLKDHRVDAFFLKKMSESVMSKFAEFGINSFIALPTLSNPYRYWKLIAKWQDIGELDYYIFPINIFKIIFKKTILKNFSFVLAFFISYCFKLFYQFSKKNPVSKISLDINNKNRKKRFFLDTYKYIYLSKNNWACYRIYNENNLNVAYIIYLNNKSKKFLSSIIFKIISDSALQVDLIMYVGNLKYRPINLVKLPNKLKPRKINFIGITENSCKKEILDFNNWDVSLVDFDMR